MLVQKEDREKAEDRGAVRGRFSKPCPSQRWVVSERFAGGKVQAIRRQEELPTRVSYLLGNDPAKHRSNLPTYPRVWLGEVWPGVEVVLAAQQKTVEKLLIPKPGTEASQVQVALSGAEGLELADRGALKVRTGLAEVELSPPVAWQEIGGKREPMVVGYQLLGPNRYGFVLGEHRKDLPVVIDPILQSTYLRESDEDDANSLALSSTGEVYVAGRTDSTGFPVTAGGADDTLDGFSDAFVAWLDPGLTSINRATYLGARAATLPLASPLPQPGRCTWRELPARPTSPVPAAGRRARTGVA